MIRFAILAWLMTSAVAISSEEWPDIRSVSPDLTVPKMAEGSPAAGQRVRYIPPENGPSGIKSTVYCSLYLPSDWQAGRQYPVLIELPGNGGYRDSLGDECSGRPEDCNLGYGLSGGSDYIWICLPFLNDAGDDTAIQWWGDQPSHRPDATIRFLHDVVDDVCTRFAGRRDQLILCGFSRGAIACNAIGLHDDETAKLWRAFVVCSHYDGVRSWPFSTSDKASALERLRRLGDRPQFICGERDQVESTRRHLDEALALSESKLSRFTLASTGFRNHSDQWILRPSATRTRLREWLVKVIRN